MNKTILVVDDDNMFCQVLANSLNKKGFIVSSANSVAEAAEIIKNQYFNYAIIDLKMPEMLGTELLKILPSSTKTIILTGFASIATAVAAIKLGAFHYLTKPVNLDEILVILNEEQLKPEMVEKLSTDRLEWEYINQTLAMFNGNISKTANYLNMHRRTLQRKLAKKPVIR